MAKLVSGMSTAIPIPPTLSTLLDMTTGRAVTLRMLMRAMSAGGVACHVMDGVSDNLILRL